MCYDVVMTEKKVQPKILPGFMELLPADQIEFNRLKDIIRGTFELFGFAPMDTPIIEKAEILLAKAGGETEKQIYRFKKGDSDLALRFDLTVPLARFVAQNYNSLTFPFRRYQIGKVFRGERAQKGRFREFYQCDIDLIGDGELSLLNDAEIPAVIYTVFKNLNLGAFVIKINNRKILNGYFAALGVTDRSEEILRVIDKFPKISRDTMREELLSLTNQKITNQILKFIDIGGDNETILIKLKNLMTNEMFNEGVRELEQVLQNIKKFGVPEENIALDPIIARGLDYYTGTIYETFLKNYPEIGSVCSGGRFDNLAEYYTNKKLPGVGASIGLTRLFYQLKEAGIIKGERKSLSKILIVPLVSDLTMPLQLAARLRASGIATEVYFDDDVKLKKKFSYADKMNIPYTAVIGEEEIEKGIITLKEMATGQQSSIQIEELIKKLK